MPVEGKRHAGSAIVILPTLSSVCLLALASRLFPNFWSTVQRVGRNTNLTVNMSLNTAHANGGVLIHAGECILLFCDNVSMEFHGQDQPEFKGSKSGRLYLTTHRMIFNAKDGREKMQSFSFPFVTLNDVELEQPVFGANYIKGKVRAQPNGNFIGEVKFKLMFKSGGAIEFGQAMLKAAQIASRNGPSRDGLPPYAPPAGPWYAAPPPAYTPAPTGYYGWVPPTNVFPSAPPPNSVFMTDMPPPYPGINGYSGYATAPPGGPGVAAGAGAVGFTQPAPSAAGLQTDLPFLHGS